MSKATDYLQAKAHAEGLKPNAIKDTDGKVIAEVDEDDGGLYLTEKFWKPAEAVQLAYWILDVFSEPQGDGPVGALARGETP